MKGLIMDTFCIECGWVGTIEELATIEVNAVSEDGNPISYPCCPVCGSLEGILPIEYRRV